MQLERRALSEICKCKYGSPEDERTSAQGRAPSREDIDGVLRCSFWGEAEHPSRRAQRLLRARLKEVGDKGTGIGKEKETADLTVSPPDFATTPSTVS